MLRDWCCCCGRAPAAEESRRAASYFMVTLVQNKETANKTDGKTKLYCVCGVQCTCTDALFKEQRILSYFMQVSIANHPRLEIYKPKFTICSLRG